MVFVSEINPIPKANTDGSNTVVENKLIENNARFYRKSVLSSLESFVRPKHLVREKYAACVDRITLLKSCFCPL